ncbi:MAG: DUF134 domain-containing protein, partial [bacterium]
KKRLIENIPEVKFFKPAGIPRRDIEEINLTMEEVEAIRLKDQEGLTQQQCADKMEISRPTFQRILVKAHQKIARALLEGKAIRFKGGDYQIARGRYYCQNCGASFQFPRKRRRRGRNFREEGCPECGDKSFKKD